MPPLRPRTFRRVPRADGPLADPGAERNWAYLPAIPPALGSLLLGLSLLDPPTTLRMLLAAPLPFGASENPLALVAGFRVVVNRARLPRTRSHQRCRHGGLKAPFPHYFAHVAFS